MSTELQTEDNLQQIGIEGLFEGQDLSQEFKEKASVIFEAAVSLKTSQIEKELEESFEQSLNRASHEIVEALTEQLDGYLDLMVEKWFDENKIALESGMKLEIFESFMGGLKTLFQESYIEIPEEKLDILEDLETKVVSLQEQLNESTEHRIALKSELQQLKKNKVIEESVKGLTELDAEKFKLLAEDVIFESQEAFQRKLEIIKESFFANTLPSGSVKAVVTDSPVLQEETTSTKEKSDLSESVQQFVKALDLLSIK